MHTDRRKEAGKPSVVVRAPTVPLSAAILSHPRASACISAEISPRAHGNPRETTGRPVVNCSPKADSESSETKSGISHAGKCLFQILFRTHRLLGRRAPGGRVPVTWMNPVGTSSWLSRITALPITVGSGRPRACPPFSSTWKRLLRASCVTRWWSSEPGGPTPECMPRGRSPTCTPRTSLSRWRACDGPSILACHATLPSDPPRKCPDRFHASRSAIGKTYLYRIHLAPDA